MELRQVGTGELDAFMRAMAFSFSERYRAEELADAEALLPLERTVGWHEDGEWVGTAAAIPFGLTVPGGAQVRAAGVTAVGVLPTHRRRGLLTGMMGALLEQAREREEPVAILFAAESPIYGRFGFGAATLDRSLRLRASLHALPRRCPGSERAPCRARGRRDRGVPPRRRLRARAGSTPRRPHARRNLLRPRDARPRVRRAGAAATGRLRGRQR